MTELLLSGTLCLISINQQFTHLRLKLHYKFLRKVCLRTDSSLLVLNLEHGLLKIHPGQCILQYKLTTVTVYLHYSSPSRLSTDQ